MDRRTFLLGGGVAFAAPAAPSDRMVLGLIGAGVRGTGVMIVLQKHGDLRVGAICDIHEPTLERGPSVAKKTPAPSELYSPLRLRTW